MRIYEWQNLDSGEVVEHNHPSSPPSEGNWKRIYSVSVGKVKGAGGSPSRPSKRV